MTSNTMTTDYLTYQVLRVVRFQIVLFEKYTKIITIIRLFSG